VLDLGVGLPDFVLKLLPACHERIVVLEGVPNTIRHTRILIDEIAALGIERKGISAVLNNRVRSETQMAWTDVQEKLGHPIATTLTPAPELFVQAIRMQSIAVLSQPTNVTSQQIFKIVDLVLEHEKAR
jgi:MinD-like ATPase involved in chromosome partitioning or flagellar assembly